MKFTTITILLSTFTAFATAIPDTTPAPAPALELTEALNANNGQRGDIMERDVNAISATADLSEARRCRNRHRQRHRCRHPRAHTRDVGLGDDLKVTLDLDSISAGSKVEYSKYGGTEIRLTPEEIAQGLVGGITTWQLVDAAAPVITNVAVEGKPVISIIEAADFVPNGREGGLSVATTIYMMLQQHSQGWKSAGIE
ncbi:hypothetical protein QBC38DRAFT_449261 [Podospora fimiseda]|uniref:Uncharacterized protein n=1 Tax=Podospora fimiseda TaxID=252190 RepID=A0AAN6YP38_9PEZI|nr:hypothetical protein QBC38DRAFT_449261 [Podospora fimiseda]